MKDFERLAKYITFSLKDVNGITGNESTSKSMLSRMTKKGYVVRIRKDLYTCVDLTTDSPVANKYQIASAINDSAFVSHHTAFEFYGVANQVYNTVYVSSSSKFNAFEFMGITYKHVRAEFQEGVTQIKNIEGIRVSDLERTFIDSLNLLTKIGGIEEMINITKAIDDLDEDRLIAYLGRYDKRVLYQKVGYFIEHFYHGTNLSSDFLDLCLQRAGNSVRYLLQGSEGQFDAKWQLVIPEAYLNNQEGKTEPDEYI